MSTIDRILKLVKDSGLTAKEFAERVGIAGGSITDWKTGRSKPSVESLQKIAKYADVQLEWLTGDSEYKTKSDEIKSIIDKLNKNYKLQLINLGISDKDVNELLSLNPVSLGEGTSEELAKPIMNKMKYITDNYSSDIIHNFLSVMKNLLLEEKNILIEENYKQLQKEFQKAIKAGKTLVNYIEENNFERMYMCPVYGHIGAGQPNWAEECIEGRIPLDPDLMHIVNPEEHFFLRVNNESMNKIVKNGAFALIHKQDTVNDGEIAVVLVNGYDATLKKFTKQDNLVLLEPQSTDESFKTQVYDKTTSIKILGKYVGKLEINK